MASLITFILKTEKKTGKIQDRVNKIYRIVQVESEIDDEAPL